MELFHRFNNDISGVVLPHCFNNPFYYSPHSLCVMASREVRDILSCNAMAAAEADKGKMFGVLVVQDMHGNVGFLAAFSGLLCGGNKLDGFVPPVYDMLSPCGYFKQEEACITALNRKIRELECCVEQQAAVASISDLRRCMEQELASMRDAMKTSKERRNALRATGTLSASEEAVLVRESQFQKAELKRLASSWNDRIAECEDKLAPLKAQVIAMKEERRKRSAALQEWLFTQFKVLDAKGNATSLLEIFKVRCSSLPPAGAGECAAPKLLQYAYLNGYRPLAMAEFWIGESPIGEVRRDGCFYGACKSKCEPILSYMLQGLDVEDNALEKGGVIEKLDIVYEDDHIVVVDKPSGVLSVPGIMGGMSVQQWLREEYLHSNELFVAHRLDMATSGLLVAAKSMEVYKELQRQFAGREVKKQYTAILEGIPQKSEGIIELPLAVDYDNRPRQKVDYTNGKAAVTRYKVVGVVECDGRQCAIVCFEPVTGRTHQLRVHAAYTDGLNSPIVGDMLYGNASERLMLHASSLSFVHPMTRELIKLKSKPSFAGIAM